MRRTYSFKHKKPREITNGIALFQFRIFIPIRNVSFSLWLEGGEGTEEKIYFEVEFFCPF